MSALSDVDRERLARLLKQRNVLNQIAARVLRREAA
jgi:hypothetical protein